MIPKVIHYIWVTSDKRKPLPYPVEAFLVSIKKYCPEYKIMCWNESNIPSSILTNHNITTDYIKLWCIHQYGGIFLDTKITLLRSFNTLLHNKCFFGWVDDNKTIGTNIIGAEKGSNFIGSLLEKYESISENGLLLNRFLLKEVTKQPEEVTIIPKVLLYPDSNCPMKSYTYTSFSSSEKVKFSIIIPIKNYNRLLEKCLGSLFSTKNTSIKFEVIVVENPPHTHQSIIGKFNIDPRLKYIRLEGKYKSMALALNEGIVKAVGEYITFLNVDETISENFFTKLEDISHNLTTPILLLSKLTQRNFCFKPLKNLSDCSPIDTYNTLVLKNSIKNLWGSDRYFEDYFDDCLFSQFILNALSKGIEIGLTSIKLLDIDKPLNYNSRLDNLYNQEGREVDGELTCIIAFANEGLEVENTVKSIRATSDKYLPILLIDDASNDGYDYEQIAIKYHCKYHKNSTRLGSAGSKDLGGNLVKTPYLCFFDAHQRLYHLGWDTFVIKILKEHPDWLLSPRTSYMRHSEYYSHCIEEEAWSEKQARGFSMGCKLIFNGGFAYEPKWVDNIFDTNDPITTPCACVLGACYVMTKTHWNSMMGLEGLKIYGLEESFMSVKTWLLGGQCRVIKTWSVGHLYRKSRNNGVTIPPNSIDLNRYILINFFGGPDKDRYIEELRNRRKDKFFNEQILQPYNKEKTYYENLRKRFFKKAKYQDLSYFNKCINSLYR